MMEQPLESPFPVKAARTGTQAREDATVAQAPKGALDCFDPSWAACAAGPGAAPLAAGPGWILTLPPPARRLPPWRLPTPCGSAELRIR